MVLNVAIIGYGRMGRTIGKLALDRGINVKSIIDPLMEKKGTVYNEIDDKSLAGVDVCIDFTRPDTLIGNLKKTAALKKNMVAGTTGWYDKEKEARKIVENSGTGFVYAPNFSTGVNLLFHMTAYCAKLFNKFPQYDEYAYELHHNRKLDSPSGTALKLGEILVGNLSRKKKLVTGRLDRKISPDEIHFASVRGGAIPGTHVIGFDSLADTIEIKHTARGREGFADGALSAAQWVSGRKGFYKFDDMINEIIGGD